MFGNKDTIIYHNTINRSYDINRWECTYDFKEVIKL